MSGDLRSLLRKSISSLAAVLTISSVILSNAPSAIAEYADEIDISTSPVCSISRLSIWESFSVPHPCFENGVLLKIKVPESQNKTSLLRVQVNDKYYASNWNAYFSIPEYTLGLNVLNFERFDESSSTWKRISQTQFIIFAKPNLFRSFFVQEPKRILE